MSRSSQAIIFSLWGLLMPLLGQADGSTIDKVYHPYVEQLEWELEWRTVQQRDDPLTGQARREVHRLGLGRALSDTVFAEIYLIGEAGSNDDLSVETVEFEVLWQLSEQGEFALDYGLLFELEKSRQEDAWEYSTSLLLERELGRFSTTANLGVIYEWGEDISDELETSMALQGRYRYSPLLEPALELYMGEDTLGVGPVVMGMARMGVRRALRWEAGVIWGLDSSTADYTLRGVLEYEF